ncbi:unnamed protein product [Heligmosomoides polygyrus]|uniref:MULE domain-containing protein n=1 Tax=Heligmosomoides polygyrus TaxID=6339 RepID=A0A183F766_HELPZ|nr:unnamed protein product [Heligmosomoides polygyrus]
MSTSNALITLQEGAIVLLPCGPHRILRLSDGNLCAVPVQLTEHQQLFIGGLDAPTLLQYRSGKPSLLHASTIRNNLYSILCVIENADVVAGELRDITDAVAHLEEVDHEVVVDDGIVVDGEAVVREEGGEQEPGPSGLYMEQVGETLGTGGRRFIGIPEKSKFGRQPVLIYKIPGQVNCYAFTHHRTYRCSKTYRCPCCMKEGAYTGVKVVGDNEFTEDPCALNHVCLPFRWLKEKSRRAFYEKCQEWKGDGKYTKLTPSTEHTRFLLVVDRRQNLHCVLSSSGGEGSYSGGPPRVCKTAYYDNKKHGLREGPNCINGARPGVVGFEPGRDEKAVENGLDTLIADGIFGVHPRDKDGQLYTIHGVCNGKVDVPLLFAITTRKGETVYRRIWTALKDALERTTQQEPRLRIILDFERASIKAVRRVFPGMWNKWGMDILRTTNIAETYHR